MQTSKSRAAALGLVAALALPALSYAGTEIGTKDAYAPVDVRSLGIVRTTGDFTTNRISLRYDLKNISGISGKVSFGSKNGSISVDDTTPVSGIGSLQLNAVVYAEGKGSTNIFSIQNVLTVISKLQGRDMYKLSPDAEIYSFNSRGVASPFATSVIGYSNAHTLDGVKDSAYEYTHQPIYVSADNLNGRFTMSEHLNKGEIVIRFTQKIGGYRFILDNVTIGHPGQFESAYIVSYPKRGVELEAGYVGGDSGKTFIPGNRGFYERLNIDSASGLVNIVPVSHRYLLDTKEMAVGLSAMNTTAHTVVFRNTLDNGSISTVSNTFRKDMELLKGLQRKPGKR